MSETILTHLTLNTGHVACSIRASVDEQGISAIQQ